MHSFVESFRQQGHRLYDNSNRQINGRRGGLSVFNRDRITGNDRSSNERQEIATFTTPQEKSMAL